MKKLTLTAALLAALALTACGNKPTEAAPSTPRILTHPPPRPRKAWRSTPNLV